MDGNFRTAINGFHRQDVLNYITDAAKNASAIKAERDILDSKLREQAQELERLNLALDSEKNTSRELSRKNDVLQKKLAALEAELESSKGMLASQTEELELLRLDMEENSGKQESANSLTSENLNLKNEIRQLQEQLKLSLEKSTEYDMLKERMLALELNASRRAVEIEAEAKQQADGFISAARLHADKLEQSRRERLAEYCSRFSALNETANELIADMDGKLDSLRIQLADLGEDFGKSVELFGKEENA